MKNRKGKNNPNYRHGLKNKIRYCKDCGKKLSNTTTTHIPVRCKSCNNKVRPYSEIKAKKISEKAKIRLSIPENNPNWQGGIYNDPYPINFNTELKREIRDRDNHTCQLCYLSEEEQLLVLNKVLAVHHINYNKENCNKKNLITLCDKCNLKVNIDRDYWFAYFTYKIKEEIYANS